ncbi:MAG: cupin [Alphaproteobacteria bacterium]|nr:cupin [Alphaproteobacteria bacterium]
MSDIADRLARSLALALAAGALTLATAPAHAGECPVDHRLTTPRAIEEKPDIGVKRDTLAVVPLKGWRGVADLYLRTRRLIVAVDGIVPTHQHDDRPSIVFVAKGEIVEHSAFCAVPILHREGEWTPEFGPGHEHWWENRSGKEVVLLSSDVIPPEYFDPGTESFKNAM